MVTDMGDISTNHIPATIPTKTQAAVSEGTYHTPHPATAAAHATLWPMDATIAICVMTYPTGIITPHPVLTTSPADVTHTTNSWTTASLIPATPSALHKKHSQEKPSHAQDLQCLINSTIPRLHYLGLTLRFFL